MIDNQTAPNLSACLIISAQLWFFDGVWGHGGQSEHRFGLQYINDMETVSRKPAPLLCPSTFLFATLIKYLACLFQHKTLSRIWWPWNFPFPAAFFNVYSHGKRWRHYLIIYRHLRFERFLILHCCNAKLFDDLRLNKTLIITKTFKNAALKSGCSSRRIPGPLMSTKNFPSG